MSTRGREERAAFAAEDRSRADAPFRALFDLMPQLGWTARADGFIEFYNRGWYEYTGTTYEVMQGWGWRDVHRPDLLPVVVERWQRSLATGEPFEMEFPLRRHDGVFRWFLTRVSPIHDDAQTIIGWVGINTDIHDRREASSQSDQSYRLLLQSVRDYAILMLGPDGRVATWSMGAATMFGYAPDEILGEHVTRLYVADDVVPRGCDAALAAATTAGRFEAELWRVRKDGSRFWANTAIAALHADDGSLSGFSEVTHDVTDRKHAAERAEAQRHAQQELDQLYDLTTDLVGIAAFDGYFKRTNPSWTSTLGWSEREIQAHPWLDFVHPDDIEATLAAGRQLGEGQTVARFQNRYRCKDGTYRWLDWQSVPVVADGLIYCIARDVTEERAARMLQEQMQRKLIVAERMVSVGTLAAGVAHEISNPLAYVRANIDMAIEETRVISGGSPSGRLKELEQMMIEARQGCDRVTKIVRGLKTFSRAEEEQRAVIQIQPVVEISINMAFNEIRHRARLVKDFGRTPSVHADDARLGQVFINLLVNAAQAIAEGDTDGNEVRIVTFTDDRGHAAIEFHDTGAGIAPEVLGRIFDPFFTTKSVGVGTGLGLSICHNIVTGMGGDISVRSELGRGTCFQVTLPPVPDVLAAEAVGPSVTTPSTRVADILCIDDEPAIGLAFRRVLKLHRMTVVTGAREALELLRAGHHYDVIVSDLMMPGMTGMDLFHELVREFPREATRMVFVTGGAFTANTAAFLDEVPNERIEKPFSSEALRVMVQKFLR
ncbi:MAG: PAS domain S-box protein [Myxococcota bacterium]|nr:PAS domain S-box protein [Myxococcota bacterium]